MPRRKKLVDGDEQVPLGVELIHDLEGGIYAFGEDIMHEDDGAVPGLGDHLLDDSGGILIPPVLRIYGPEDDRAAGVLFDALVGHPVGRAQKEVVVPQNMEKALTGLVDLGVEIGLGETGELYVVKGVDSDLVSLRVHALDHILVVDKLFSNQEKGGVDAPLSQTVQQSGGGGAARAVIKGQSNQLLTGLGGGRAVVLRQGLGRVGIHRRSGEGKNGGKPGGSGPDSKEKGHQGRKPAR